MLLLAPFQVRKDLQHQEHQHLQHQAHQHKQHWVLHRLQAPLHLLRVLHPREEGGEVDQRVKVTIIKILNLKHGLISASFVEALMLPSYVEITLLLTNVGKF